MKKTGVNHYSEKKKEKNKLNDDIIEPIEGLTNIRQSKTSRNRQINTVLAVEITKIEHKLSLMGSIFFDTYNLMTMTV